MSTDLSVLMTCYRGDSAPHFREALESIRIQTLSPRELVLVVDGPVPAEIDGEIKRFCVQDLPFTVNVIRLAASRRLSGALNAGLPHCQGEWIARMDSDDISAPDRFEKQWAYLAAHPDIGLLAAWNAEFIGDPSKPFQFKTAPETHEEIMPLLRWRNIISHPTVIMKRQAVLDCGGYRTDTGLFEDHDLFLRLAKKGSRLACMQEALLFFRVSEQQRGRRGGFRYAMLGVRLKLRWAMTGVVPVSTAVLSSLALTLFALLPVSVKNVCYKMLRKPVAKTH